MTGWFDAGAAVALEMRRAFLWLPVLMGCGIWAYFTLATEPPVWTAGLVALPAAGLLLPGLRGSLVGRGLLVAALAVLAGYALVLWSAHRVAAPVAPALMQETVEGRVIALDRSASDAPRILLDRVHLFGREAWETPARVRVSLLATELAAAPRPGETVRVFATLLPPGDPVEPGAFDFGQRAFFEGLGAVGYTRITPVRVPPEERVGGPAEGWLDRARVALAEVRLALSEHVRAALPGASGAFAAAIMVGDRAAIVEADAEALRISSLAHLLAISGLHMGLLTGLVFGAVRLGLALVPPVSLGLSTKKIAAATALAAGLGYLLLSGSTVATQRAFVMVAVAFLAVMIDRTAISLRGLAIAAIIVLAIRPVSLFDVGFQMSFAATVALVASYEEIRRLRQALRAAREGEEGAAPGLPARLIRTILLWAAGVAFTSLVAGLATTPFSTYHFNRVAPYGLLANLGAVPVMGLVIAPGAVATAIAAPFGLAALPLEAMGAGIDWVLAVAHWTAALPGADRTMQTGAALHLAMIALGGLWLALWRGRWRLLGAGPVLAGALLWGAAPPERPALLVAPGGKLVGLLGPEGRALDHPKTQSYAAEVWLRRDGERVAQEVAAARPGLERRRRGASGALPNGWRVEVTHETRIGREALAALCTPRTILIARHGAEAPPGGCVFFGKRRLREIGAVAVWPDGAGVRIATSAEEAPRLWNRRPGGRRHARE